LLFKKFLLTSFLIVGISIEVDAFPGGDFINTVKSKFRSACNSASDGWTLFKDSAGPKVKFAYKSAKNYTGKACNVAKNYAGRKVKSAYNSAKNYGYDVYLKARHDLGLIHEIDREGREVFVFGRDVENSPFIVLESRDGFKFVVPEWVENYSGFVKDLFSEENTNGHIKIENKEVNASALYLILKCIAIFDNNCKKQDQDAEKLENVCKKSDIEAFLVSQNDRLNHWYNINVCGLRQKLLNNYLRDIILTVDFLKITNVDIEDAIVFQYSKSIGNLMSNVFKKQTDKIKDENLVYKIVEASSNEIFEQFKKLEEEFEDEDNENENSSLKDGEEKEFFDN
jgi:hypothetical protein